MSWGGLQGCQRGKYKLYLQNLSLLKYVPPVTITISSKVTNFSLPVVREILII